MTQEHETPWQVYSPEIAELQAERRQFRTPTETHPTPQSAEQVARAERITAKLSELMNDSDFAGVSFISIVDYMLSLGRITEEQYLELHQVYRS